MTPSFAVSAPLRAELPQFANQLAAERIARAEPADFGVGPRALIDPILEALEFVEVGARRTRQSSDRREAERIERRGQRRERDRAKRGGAEKRDARRPREEKHQRSRDGRDNRRRDEVEMMDVGGLDAQEQRAGDREAPSVRRRRRLSRERAQRNAAPASAASAGIIPTQSPSSRRKTAGACGSRRKCRRSHARSSSAPSR